MRIDHNVVRNLEDKKALNKTWRKAFQCGVNFKKPYMRGGKPTSYQKLFEVFVIITGYKKGVSGKMLRENLGWRQGTHSDYFAMFTDNKIFKYNSSTRLYEQGENFDEYIIYSRAKKREALK
jgi:hypothetical protein